MVFSVLSWNSGAPASHDRCRLKAAIAATHPGMGISLALFNANEVVVTNDEMDVLDELN
ncbi:hypothetical protein [Aeromonas hydrophila]|uniref:hypothetical protein n=1 Tax=Aeromonas hydrophila TaxID=644 RepID=UPI00214EDC47|nr:hypothetical protein [Aeromonas hydrophila]MCR3951012.1 hypothetical protein [Aeromonas hydrophila]MCW4613791.1 hypothetical protein [Aeromonas hydrophila]